MEDTIYRQEALEGLYDVFFDDELSAAYPKEADKVLDVIRKLPSARAERMGHWILSDDREWKTCANCGAEVDVSMGTGVYVGVDAVDEMYFCPNCGADMRGESDE